MFNVIIILGGISAMLLSTVILTVFAYWLVTKMLEYVFGKN